MLSIQVRKQTQKIIHVLTTSELHPKDSVVREFAILKLDYNEKNSARINHTVDFYGARMLDFSENVLMVEVSGSTEKIDSIIQEFGKKIVLESMRTGKTGLKKGKRNT